MNDLQSVALGRSPADLVVEGGRVYVASRDSVLERDVAVVGDRIAALPADGADLVGPDTTVVPASDRVVLPGFIDAHTHADIHVTPDRVAPSLLESGTTAVVTEASGLGVTFGAEGVAALLSATAELPVSTFVCVPPQPLADTFEPARADDDEAAALADLLARDRVVGVGEIDWIHVVGRESPLETLVERADREGVRVVGHGAGCREERLRAFATVVDNDHESITVEDAVARADNGIHVVARCGSIRDDLAAVTGAFDRLERSSVSLSTDGIWPPDLREGFGMADLVRRAIEDGLDPTAAIDAATRNTARHFGLADRGVVAPGAVADLVVVEDLESVAVETVVSGGEVVVRDGDAAAAGRTAAEGTTDTYPDFVRDSVSVPTDRERFTAPLEAASDGRVRAMAVGEGLLTRERTVEPRVADGRLEADPGADVLTATLLDRDPGTPPDGFTGFLTGLGMDAGAVATTNTWEVPGVAVVAADADDAAVATERVAATGGGWAVVRDGEVLADLPMPVAAAAADRPVDAVADGFDSIATALGELGVDADRPLVTLQTLSFPGVPALKLSFSGYADVLDRSVVGLEPPT